MMRTGSGEHDFAGSPRDTYSYDQPTASLDGLAAQDVDGAAKKEREKDDGGMAMCMVIGGVLFLCAVVGVLVYTSGGDASPLSPGGTVKTNAAKSAAMLTPQERKCNAAISQASCCATGSCAWTGHSATARCETIANAQKKHLVNKCPKKNNNAPKKPAPNFNKLKSPTGGKVGKPSTGGKAPNKAGQPAAAKYATPAAAKAAAQAGAARAANAQQQMKDSADAANKNTAGRNLGDDSDGYGDGYGGGEPAPKLHATPTQHVPPQVGPASLCSARRSSRDAQCAFAGGTPTPAASDAFGAFAGGTCCFRRVRLQPVLLLLCRGWDRRRTSHDRPRSTRFE